MIKFLINKITGKKSKSELESEKFVHKINSATSKISELSNFFLKNITHELSAIYAKSKNLLETNHQLGLNHIKKGNLKDARFRFAIIIRFWPKFYEAHYQKAYVEMLLDKPEEALKTIEKFEINNDDVNDDKFNDLKQQILLSIEDKISKEDNNLKSQ